MIRKISREFYNANILKVTVEHNGFQGGDAGHGGFVKINIADGSNTCMLLNGKEVEEFTIEFRGDTERQTLTQALSLILCELLLHENNSPR